MSLGPYNPQHMYMSMFRPPSQFGDFVPGYPGSESGTPEYSFEDNPGTVGEKRTSGPTVGGSDSSPYNFQEQMKKMMPFLMLMQMFPGNQNYTGGRSVTTDVASALSPLVGMGTFGITNALLGNPFKGLMGGMMGGQ